jgi:hypothetical protein
MRDSTMPRMLRSTLCPSIIGDNSGVAHGYGLLDLHGRPLLLRCKQSRTHSMPSQLLLCLLAAFISGIPLYAATNVVPAIVTTNTTLIGTNLIQGTVTIQSNVIVSISPGAVMLMNTGAVLVVNGQLLADGTTNQPIYFTRAFTAARWSRILFNRAGSSRFRSCIFEYANSAGEHQDYYPTNCSTGQGLSPRPYHEAIVALATQLDFNDCTFRNLVGGGGGNEGDAIAIISDDPQLPGTASATVRSCRFDGIGQAIHTRFSYVLVENCYFANKHGDNDDVDLYGESTPPPLILNNTFLSGHEDKINPTRCSAIIMGNFISGSDDHGVVLRDRCSPIVVNNIFSNCTSAALSVQNQCDALIANNTIVNCGRGVRLFDHTSRHGPPYCLSPGNGKATVINTIIWNSSIAAFTLEQSSFLPYPHLTVINCDVQGGRSSITTNGSNNTIIWGPGNIDANPLFSIGQQLSAASPCIDAGTNAILLASSNWSASVTNDYWKVPRPLDGNGANGAAYDIGAHEYLLASADSNGDGIPDGWTWQYRLNPADPSIAASNPDADPHTTYQEWIADTNPTNALSHFRVAALSNATPVRVQFSGSSNRLYTLSFATNFVGAGPATIWTDVAGQVNVPGSGSTQTLSNVSATSPQQFYRVRVAVP